MDVSRGLKRRRPHTRSRIALSDQIGRRKNDESSRPGIQFLTVLDVSMPPLLRYTRKVGIKNTGAPSMSSGDIFRKFGIPGKTENARIPD